MIYQRSHLIMFFIIYASDALTIQTKLAQYTAESAANIAGATLGTFFFLPTAGILALTSQDPLLSGKIAYDAGRVGYNLGYYITYYPGYGFGYMLGGTLHLLTLGTV